MTRLINADDIPWFVEGVGDIPVVTKDEIDRMPTVDAVPVRHGRWMPREEGKVYPFWERYTCSVCGEHADNTQYCPNCGARMVEDE